MNPLKTKLFSSLLIIVALALISFLMPMTPAKAFDLCPPLPAIMCSGSTEIDMENPYCQGDDCGIKVGADAVGDELNGISTSQNAKDLILGWVNFFLSFLFIIAVIVIVVAGVMLIVSFGNDAKRQKAIKMIIWTIVGLILIMFAFAIVNTIIRATA